ncbi:MAG TPA: response regulator [Syntrophales bacterium]|nr:response regulator [Syntrophales bacterium]
MCCFYNLRSIINLVRVMGKNMEDVRRKILVVDDEELIGKALRIILAEEGAVEYARNGREALAKSAVTSYDVFIVDMNMPVMNGMDFYKEAVKTLSGIKERIIFFTGSCEEGYFSFFRENNLRFLEKPLEPEKLKNRIRQILDSKALTKL